MVSIVSLLSPSLSNKKSTGTRIFSIIVLAHWAKPYHVLVHKTSNKQKTEYMIVGSRQRLCNIIDDPKIELGRSTIKRVIKTKILGIINEKLTCMEGPNRKYHNYIKSQKA